MYVCLKCLDNYRAITFFYLSIYLSIYLTAQLSDAEKYTNSISTGA